MLDKKFEEPKQVERLYEWSELDEAITRTYEMSMRLRESGSVGVNSECRVSLEHLQKLLRIEEAFFSAIYLPLYSSSTGLNIAT